MLSPVRLSVHLQSIRQVDHTKTVEVRIMKFSPYGSPIPLVHLITMTNARKPWL